MTRRPGEEDMKLQRFFIIVLISLLAILAGCAQEKYPGDVVAAVNGKTIARGDIEQKLTERKMTIAIADKIHSSDPEQLNVKDVSIQSLGIPEEELKPEQNRYLESVARLSTKVLSDNEAFNLLLMEEVFYQEAVKQGHEVSISKAKKIINESNVITKQAQRGNSEDELKKRNQLIHYIDEVYNHYGFKSEEDYLNQRMDKTAQALTISRMKNRFDEVMADQLFGKLPVPDTYQISNAWDDYGEFLLDKAKVKIINAEYSQERYGEPWDYGRLDLK